MEGRGWGGVWRDRGQQEADLRAQSAPLELWGGQRPGGKSRHRHLDSEIVIFLEKRPAVWQLNALQWCSVTVYRPGAVYRETQ